MSNPSCMWTVSIASIARSRGIHDSAIASSVPKLPTQAPLKQIAAIGSSATLQPFATTCPFGADRASRADRHHSCRSRLFARSHRSDASQWCADLRDRRQPMVQTGIVHTLQKQIMFDCSDVILVKADQDPLKQAG